MQSMSKTQVAPELAFSQTSAIPKHFSTSCIFAKAHRAPFNKNVDRSKTPLEKVHSDINGPLPYPSLRGAHYFFTFIDDYSRFMHLYVVTRKSDLYDCYEKFRKAAKNRFNTEVGNLETQFNQYDSEVQRLQSDNGKEYEKLGQIIFDRYDTHAQFTNAYTPQQNGVAERQMRTILERVRALLIDGDLPRQLWGECCQYVTHLINVTTSSVLPTGVTPYELWHGKKPSLTYIKVFGCAAFALTPEPHRNKLEARAKLCMIVDLPQNKKGYRLLSTTENRIIYSRDVIIAEMSQDTFPNLTFLERATPDPLSTSLPVQKELLPPLSVLRKHSQASLVAFDADVCSPSAKKVKTEDTLAIYSKALLLNEPIDLEEEHTLHHTIVSLLAVRYDPGPKIYMEVMRFPHASDWHAAALSGYGSLMENQTWTLVPRPHNRKVLQCQWVFVRKRGATGRVVRFKAHLVVKGFQQNYGIDYTEIFSPVVRKEILRLLLTLAAILDYEIGQMDVKTAFLNGSLDVAIFMEQPEGFASKDHPDLVCSLGKSPYGLKQAPRVWYHTFAKYLERLGFTRLVKDRCVFYKVIFNAPCYISVYVDDMLIISPSKQIVARVKSALSSEFHMTDLGGVSYLLGWTIERNRANSSIFIHQRSYTTNVLDRFSMLDRLPKDTPIAQKPVATDCPTDDETKTIMPNKLYRNAVGSFMYLVTGTRPDLAILIREISQYLDNPGLPH
ncbi:LOW QUALITY PROTEIN: Integrase catalytic core protein [Phytophthora palmivora]|uniref:Integrase catalytic core protein n=1 Tax=Phytophthora palmivora TaxID=4796 RepID=A0A2P4Y2C9_9STRA|nr:LOW QUALITY PROTEIN: Integrase catalytic core protein [Phytophthora palmivora]